MSVIDDAVLSYGLGSVGGHLDHAEDALHACAAAGIAMSYVGTSVLIPYRTGVDDAFRFMHEHGSFPRTCRILGLDHDYTDIGVAVVDVVLAVVVAYCGSPHGAAMIGVGHELCILGHLGNGMTYQSPVHKILGMEDGQSGYVTEA